MKLLSIQQVEAYGFTLYFLAFTDETPPNEDLNSIEIREWLWQRPYTTIEHQQQHRQYYYKYNMEESSLCYNDSDVKTKVLTLLQ